MGDHRISFKAEFEMHGHKAKVDQWINYSERWPQEIAQWLEHEISVAKGIYFDAEYDLEQIARAEREDAERTELARLKAKYEAQ